MDFCNFSFLPRFLLVIFHLLFHFVKSRNCLLCCLLIAFLNFFKLTMFHFSYLVSFHCTLTKNWLAILQFVSLLHGLQHIFTPPAFSFVNLASFLFKIAGFLFTFCIVTPFQTICASVKWTSFVPKLTYIDLAIILRIIITAWISTLFHA